jgi:hypothetical protein
MRGRLRPTPGRGSKSRVALDGSGVRAEPAHEQGRRQETAGDLAHHRLGQGEGPAAGLPDGLQGRRVGAVTARADAERAGRAGGSEAEAAGPAPPDEAAEDRLAVEARDAQPVDGAVRGDQRGGARVAQHRVVLDRRRHVRTPRAADRGPCRRRRVRDHGHQRGPAP